MAPESVAPGAFSAGGRRTRLSSIDEKTPVGHSSTSSCTPSKQPSFGSSEFGFDDIDEDLVTRNVRLSDNHLLHLALEAAQAIDWQALAQPPSSAWIAVKSKTKARRSRMKRSDVPGAAPPAAQGASVYTREANFTHPPSFAAMAHTVVPCPLQELALMLESTSSDQFGDVMQAMHGDALVSAELVHQVETDKSLSSNRSSSGLLVKAVLLDKSKRRHSSSSHNPSSSPRSSRSSSSSRDNLSSKAKHFFRSRQQRGSEEWCYIDFVQRISPKCLRKTVFTLHPSNVLVGNEYDEYAATGKKQSQGTFAGYLFEETKDGKSTRVSFWGEHVYTQNGGALRRAFANRAVKARVLGLAASIDKFIFVVRRRRLGMQVMVDEIRVTSSNTSCACCDRSFLLTRKKICNLCGYNVCEKCSQMHDRERRSPDGATRLSVSRVRICEKCIARVDQCSFVNTTLQDLSPPQIYADPSPTSSTSSSSSSSHRGSKSKSPVTTGALLTRILYESLQSAPETNRAPVLNIIKHLVDQERGSATGASSFLTDESTEKQHFDALQSRLRDPPLPLDECRLASAKQRSYLIGHCDDPTVSHPHPIPLSEERRLEIIRSSKLMSLEGVEELDVICAVVSKELACLGALISISETDAFHVVATNIDFLPTRVFPRNEGFCSRTIMGVDPMLVPHPEADLRFSYILPVKQMNVSFYCGFPLFAEDFTVLGSLCCLGHETRKLTQAQFTVGKKLAETASRILQHHVRLRQSRTEL